VSGRMAIGGKTMGKWKIAILTAAICTAVAALVPASALAEFGFSDLNTGAPGAANAPAFSVDSETGQPAFLNKAVWAGTCDLSSASTADGGYGLGDPGPTPGDPGGVEPPTVHRGCIDVGTYDEPQVEINNNWTAGKEPRWRLDPVTQAGAHPDATAAFWFAKRPGGSRLDGNVRDIIVRLPPGVVGSPTALPQCSAVDAQAIPPTCSPSTQAGVVALVGSIQHDATYPVYNTEARDTVTAEFTIGFAGALFNVPVSARGRTNGDYGVDTLSLLVPTFSQLFGATFTLWGVPWAGTHDSFRTPVGYLHGGALARTSIPSQGLLSSEQAHYEPAWGPIEPFFTNPTRCQPSPLAVGFDVDSWDNPGRTLPDGSPDTSDPNWKTNNFETPLLSGCDKLHFDPSIVLHPTVNVADSPSGLDVTLKTPQNTEAKDEATGEPLNPPAPGASPAEVSEYVEKASAYWKTGAGLGTAHLKDTVVHLPAGTSFNPAAADGLQGCTTKQIGLTSASPQVLFNNDIVTCPDNSQIGTLKIDSPLLPDPLQGRVYAAPQSDNPFPGSLTSIYLVAQDEERGLSVKLAGKVDLDPATGQISTTFLDNPQLPFDQFELHFKSGSRAPLNTPATCGHYENSADLTPWSFPDSGPQPTVHDPFEIASMPNGLACVQRPQDRTFKPGFEAGTTSTQAGTHTDFALNVSRQDGEQELAGIALHMAPGLVASLKGLAYCSEAQIAAAKGKPGLAEANSPSCPPSSYIGKVDAAAGAGPTPLHTPGRLYLAGPYNGAPLSVVTIAPAIAGGTPGNPAFDLGNVVIRTGVNLDPESAQVQIESTKVPYIVGGVPLRVRKVAVDLDRPDFMLNPTSCEPFSLDGVLAGAADPLNPSDDVTAKVSNRFQAGGCEKLAFKPKLSIQLSGGTKRTDHPALRATLTYPPGGGYANVKSAQVALPHSEFLDQAHIRTICTRVQFAAKQCPAGSIYGYARAFTPLLDQPLEGPVYLRSSSNPLPDLVAALRGPASQPIEVVLDGRTDSIHAGLRNTFEAAPDAPVEKFILTLKGGKKGLLINSTNICVKTKVAHRDGRRVTRQVPGAYAADANFTAHNGKTLHQTVPIKASGCQKAKRHKKRSTSPRKQ
jgi:hypothetical protein